MAAPTIGHVKTSPHALAWNIGTTGITTDLLLSPITSWLTATKECKTLER